VHGDEIAATTGAELTCDGALLTYCEDCWEREFGES